MNNKEAKGDLISREALKKAVDTWDKFGYTAQGELIRLTEENKDLYVPYIKYQDIINCIDNAQPVEPKQPKWIEVTDKRGHSSYFCSRCGTQKGKIEKTCPNCGTDLRGYTDLRKPRIAKQGVEEDDDSN